MISSLWCLHQPPSHFNKTSASGRRLRVFSIPWETVPVVGGEVPLAEVSSHWYKKEGKGREPYLYLPRNSTQYTWPHFSLAAILPLKSYQTVTNYRTAVSLEKEMRPKKSSFTGASSLDATTFERTIGPSLLGPREQSISLRSPLAVGPLQ